MKARKKKKKVLSSIPYRPYKGGGGPDYDQEEANCLGLHWALKGLGIGSTVDTDGPTPMLVVLASSGERIYINYERWGFFVEGGPCLEETVSLPMGLLKGLAKEIPGVTRTDDGWIMDDVSIGCVIDMLVYVT